MQISWIAIKNYKSYNETEKIYFSNGFNVIVGQNNVGKTALIDALGQKFTGNPHRSIKIHSNRVNPLSEVIIALSLSNVEFEEVLLEYAHSDTVNIAVNDHEDQPEHSISKLKQILSHPNLELHYKICANHQEGPRVKLERMPAHGIYKAYQTQSISSGNEVHYRFARFNQSEDRGELILTQGFALGMEDSSIESKIYPLLLSRVYVFKAERLNIGICDGGTNQILNADASNLPEVLHNLQTRSKNKFNKLNQYVKTIFPSIHAVSVISRTDFQLEIVTWPNEAATDREDLMIPLSDSGTGVGQALAILYVALTMERPRPIIIDEPNSFLHPAATRKLIEILKEFPHHQFIVSTHSSEVIKAAQAKTLKLIRWNETHSQIEQFESDQLKNIKECLLEVGAKLSDVFGADQILWVEGPTEEEAFNLLQNKGLIQTNKSTNIIAVRSTGDFDKKNKHINLIMDIYTKLSHGNALIPAAVGFIFDKEKLKESEIEDISRRSNGLISFLPRKMYECYILVPEAIQYVLNTLPTFSTKKVTIDTVENWIKNNAKKFSLVPFNSFSQEWLEDVDAANLLKGLFSELSSSMETYDKRLHSVAITEAIVDLSLESHLSELIGLVNAKFDS